MDRREFLKGTAWMTAAAAAAGCLNDPLRVFGNAGAPMQGFALKPMDRVRVAFVGVGVRGSAAVHRVSMVPGTEVACVCDLFPDRVDRQLKWLTDHGKPAARGFSGAEAYRRVCARDDVDVVYISVPWYLHVQVALEAMGNGKVALVEVPGCATVEEGWNLVETSERTRIPCMMLENCCYGEPELLCLNMVKKGVLGDLVHCEAGYIHDCRGLHASLRYHTLDGEADAAKAGKPTWPLAMQQKHVGNSYPTHGLGPVAQCLDINRGDAFDYMVSVESRQDSMERFFRGTCDDWRKGLRLGHGDMNVSTIRTKRGCTILLEYDTYSPRPYTRLNLVSGTNGLFRSYPELKMSIAERLGDGATHKYFDKEKTEEMRVRYMHPLWKVAGEISQKVGGHDGMDFLMDLRWSYCLQNGLPLDNDVYDLAAWSSIVELSERSVRTRSASVDFPDFTRGAWKTTPGFPVNTMDFSRFHGKFGEVFQDAQEKEAARSEGLT